MNANAREWIKWDRERRHNSTSRMYRLILLALVSLLSGCSERRFQQTSSSMWPTILSNEIVVADMAAYADVPPKRWDVVVFHGPAAQQIWLMRVIALPNERLEIRDDGIYINGQFQKPPAHLRDIRFALPPHPTRISYPYQTPRDSYFVLGDNPDKANDSRYWGYLPEQDILGRVKDN